MARAPRQAGPATQEVEVFPEADRLEGYPHPRETAALFGHASAERDLVEAFAAGRMHHAWLLAGRAGIGKATLAYRLARHALAAPGERDMLGASLDVAADTTAARQVRALSHPGLLVIRRPYDPKSKRFAASIPVDEVRRLRNFLSHSAGADAWRVVIVDSADELNTNAANALLKSLEEPPPRAMFLLVASEPGRLLPTIRSRCRRLDLAPLTEADLRRAVAQAMATAAGDPIAEIDWPRFLRIAQGSVRQVLTLAGGGGLELAERIARLVGALPRLDWTAVHTLSDELAPAAAEQKFETFYTLTLGLIARLVRARATGAGEADDLALAARLIADDALASWAELWETASRERADADALNLDRKTLILSLFSRLEAAAAR